jgi:hypothetical protein
LVERLARTVARIFALSLRKSPNPDFKKARRLASIWMKRLMRDHLIGFFGPICKLMMAIALLS